MGSYAGVISIISPCATLCKSRPYPMPESTYIPLSRTKNLASAMVVNRKKIDDLADGNNESPIVRKWTFRRDLVQSHF